MAGIFNLQTVQRSVPIAYVANAQETVDVIGDLSQRRHENSVGAFVSNAEPKDRRLAQAPLHARDGLITDYAVLPSCRFVFIRG